MNRLLDQIGSHRKAFLCALLLMLADAFALVLSLLVAFILRFDDIPIASIYNDYLYDHLRSFAVALIVYLLIFYLFKLYKYAWRFASLEMLLNIVAANTIGLIMFLIIQSALDGSIFPRSIFLLFWMIGTIMIGGVRLCLRLSSTWMHNFHEKSANCVDGPRKNVIILGGGTAGARVLRGIREDGTLKYNVIGFLDDNPDIIGTIIGNVGVLGPLSMLEDLLDSKRVDEVIMALPETGGHEIRKYVFECRKRKIPVKIVPYLRDMLNGRNRISLEDISVEDLLKRPPIKIDLTKIGGYIGSKRVLVTGAGGSIGSELCRQICMMKPASLILLGHGENSIFEVHKELKTNHPELIDRMHCVIASIADEWRINQVFSKYRPQVVFHAAAHKHVPIMENNLQEAIHNNVIGTANVAFACGRYRVQRMVLISTDKAANPVSIMGATKWLCEQIALAASKEWPDTSYITVRFGNVLGSRGSVVPLFKEQIRRGEPVTVTHPDMTRYFMTIPEAVQLVLQSGAVGESGELYLLDMGDPVKIVDLAKDMIRLSGLEPDVDIPIVFTGIRPGEKLHEELATSICEIRETEYEKLSLVYRPDSPCIMDIRSMLDKAKQVVRRGDEEQIEAFLDEYIPGFYERRINGDFIDTSVSKL